MRLGWGGGGGREGQRGGGGGGGGGAKEWVDGDANTLVESQLSYELFSVYLC